MSRCNGPVHLLVRLVTEHEAQTADTLAHAHGRLLHVGVRTHDRPFSFFLQAPWKVEWLLDRLCSVLLAVRKPCKTVLHFFSWRNNSLRIVFSATPFSANGCLSRPSTGRFKRTRFEKDGAPSMGTSDCILDRWPSHLAQGEAAFAWRVAFSGVAVYVESSGPMV